MIVTRLTGLNLESATDVRPKAFLDTGIQKRYRLRLVLRAVPDPRRPRRRRNYVSMRADGPRPGCRCGCDPHRCQPDRRHRRREHLAAFTGFNPATFEQRARVQGEIACTAVQLRMFATVVRDGSLTHARLDTFPHRRRRDVQRRPSLHPTRHGRLRKASKRLSKNHFERSLPGLVGRGVAGSCPAASGAPTARDLGSVDGSDDAARAKSPPGPSPALAPHPRAQEERGNGHATLSGRRRQSARKLRFLATPTPHRGFTLTRSSGEPCDDCGAGPAPPGLGADVMPDGCRAQRSPAPRE